MVLMVLGYLLFIVGTNNPLSSPSAWCSSTCRRPSSRMTAILSLTDFH